MSRYLLTASLLATALPAFAQTTPDHTHDEIIVTGILADRNAEEIVTNVTALDRAEIVFDLKSTLGDTLDRQPGVSTSFFGAGASRPILRGLGAERVLVLTNGIGTIDVSAASPDHQVGADGIDAERIEILRGPSALAFGGQAIGGVVNVIDGLIAEDLPDAPAVEAYGAYNSAFDGLEGAAKGEVALGPLVLNASVSARDFDDYDIPGEAESDVLMAAEGEVPGDAEGGTVENSFVETLTLSAGASVVLDTLGDGAFLGVAVRDTASEYGLPGGHEHEDGEAEEEEENPFIDLDQTRIDLRAGIDFDDSPVSAVRANAAIVDYFHTEFEAPGEAGTTYDREGWEGRLEARTAFGDMTGAFGLQTLSSDLVSEGEEAFITPTETESVAGFAFQRVGNETNPFSAEGGVRLESVRYDNIRFGEADFDLISASAGAHLHPSDPLFFGVEVAYTERAPNESELFADGIHLATNQFEVGNSDLAEERGLNVEATARYDRGDWRVGANLFRTDFDNFTTLLPGSTVEDGEIVTEVEDFPVFVFIQDGAEFAGGEIYAEADFAAAGADWTTRASVDFVDGDLDGGANVPFLPPVTFNVDATADFGLAGATAAVTVAGDQDDPGPGQLATDGYTTLDLGAFVNLDRYVGAEGTQAFLQVRNVTDADIRYATSVLKDVAPAPGRNVRAGLRVAF